MDALMIATGGVPLPGATSTPAAGDSAMAGVLRCADEPAPFAMLMAALVPPAGPGATASAPGELPAVPGAGLAELAVGAPLPLEPPGWAVAGPLAGAAGSELIDVLTPQPDRAAEAGVSGLESILAALLLTAAAVTPSPEEAAGLPAEPLAGVAGHGAEAVPAELTGGSLHAATPSLWGSRDGVEARAIEVAAPGRAIPDSGPAPGRSAPLAAGGLPAGGLPAGTLPVGALAGATATSLTATTAADQPAARPAPRVPGGGLPPIAPGVAGAEAAEAGAETPAPLHALVHALASDAWQVEQAAELPDGAGTPASVPLPVSAAGLTSAGAPGDVAAGVTSERSGLDAASGSGLADGLAESVQGALRRGERDMRLVLNPPELGEVHVRIQESAAGVRVALEAATSEAHDLIQRHLPALREGLVSRDLPVDRLDVQRLERGTDSAALDGGAGRGASGDGQAGNRWAGATGEGFGGPGEPGWSPVTRLGLGGRADDRALTMADSPVSRDAGAGRIDVRA